MKSLRSYTLMFLLLIASSVLQWPSLFAEEKPLRTIEDRAVDVEHIKLDLTVAIEKETISGTATINFQPFRELEQLTLDAVALEVTAVRLTSAKENEPQELRFDRTAETLTVYFNKPLPRRTDFQLAIDYSVHKPKVGLYFTAKTEAASPSLVWTQGEPETNRYWFPCFDHPHERQSSELIVTTKAGLTVLSNGQLISKTDLPETEQVKHHWKQDASHVSYLVTLVVGTFELVEEDWNGKPVQFYIPPKRAEDVARTFGNTSEMLTFFSERFGIEYPWEKYAQVVLYNFTSGGMENTSATSLHDGTLFDERASLDTTSDWLIAHELAHQWWGDLVTCKDWSHIWLNEGFASYCEILWDEHQSGADERDYHLFQDSNRARSGAALSKPLVDRRYEHPTEMFDVRAYPKGAWVLHMLRRHVGDEDFFRCVNRYGIEYSFNTAETDDLRKVFERLLGLSLERFFYDWTERPGHPELKVKTSYNNSKKQVRIEIEQTQKWDPFQFPLKIEVWGKDDEKAVLEEFITDKEGIYFLDLPTTPRLVRIDPEFSLLSKIEEDKSRVLWMNQLEYAPTINERIRAADHLAKAASAENLKLLQKALEDDSFYGVQIEIAQAIGKAQTPQARDILIKALEHPHPKTRRAVVNALKKFEKDSVVADALEKKLEAGDKSYYVVAATISALSTVRQNAPLYKTIELLDRDSHRDVIRCAVLESLGYCHDPRALDLLLQWTSPDRYHACRRAAMNGIVQYIEENNLPLGQQKQIVTRLTEYLNSPSPLTRRSSTASLGKIGEGAGSALSKLRDMAENDPDGWSRLSATNAVKQIEDADASRSEIKSLRDDIEKLRKQQEELGKRFDEFDQP
ncbi:Aminopeptidase N [Polystyrenella longa]|uniref:Aminopeptidase N n=1 Tax=Polystyrenella longa TaxID=2528007 RepID=A0A518CH48_9PLAN|nr:M1 family aminopeptidase [Polystyrenella longa]QDU78548.1 Aminopeptidase N [Polystyrenella longa]